ncbi:hypothetical protein KY289_016425 [Solanum tuberosum]|nr:hypothetical protein KY289_016425 [Solanum tuberosum]
MPLIVGTRNLVVSSSGSPSHLFLLVFLGDSIYYLHCYKVVGGHPKGSIRHACAYVASGCLRFRAFDALLLLLHSPISLWLTKTELSFLFGEGF